MARTVMKLGSADAGARISSVDFAAAEFAEPFRYERAQGRLVVMSPAGPEHRRVSRPFRRALGGYWEQHPDVVDDVDIEGWVVTSTDSDRVPDICVYLAGLNSGQIVPRRVPDLIFEFVSEEASDKYRDYVEKRAEYHRIGVREYVIVDRLKKSVLVMTWQTKDYKEPMLGSSEVYITPLLPGLAVSLADAFDDR